MRPFCEIVVGRIFPILRALLARELEKMGHTQVEIATYLMITQPAISQYKRRLRGKNAKLLEDDAAFMKEIRISATRIAKNKNAYAAEMCRLCKLIRENKLICNFCPDAEFSKDVCKGCVP